MLCDRADLEQMLSTCVRQVVVEAEHILPQAQTGGELWTKPRHAANVDGAGELTARRKHGQHVRRVRFDVLPDTGAAVSRTQRVEDRRRHGLPVFGSGELIGRDERPGELREVRGQPLLGVVERVTRKHLRAVGRYGVHSSLQKVLREFLIKRERVPRKAATEVVAVRAWELVEERHDGRIHGDGRHAGQNPEPRIVVGNGGDDGAAERFEESLVTPEEKEAVAADGTTDRAAKLITCEVRLLADVEVVLRVKCFVAVKLKCTAAESVGA